jgi:hypothetical protein
MYPNIEPSAPELITKDYIVNIVNEELDKRFPKILEKKIEVNFTLNIDDQINNLPSGSFGILNILENNLHYNISIFKLNLNIESTNTTTKLKNSSLIKYIKKNNVKTSRIGFLIKEYFNFKYNTYIKKIILFDIITSKNILLSINTSMSIPKKIINHEGHNSNYIRTKNGLYIKYMPLNLKLIKKIY